VWAVAAVAVVEAVLVVIGLTVTSILLHVAWISALVLLPGALFVAIENYRNLGHGHTADYLLVRYGVLARRTAALRRSGIIGVTVRQSPFQRRLGLADLTATTGAGSGAFTAYDADAAEALGVAGRVVPELLDPFAVRDRATLARYWNACFLLGAAVAARPAAPSLLRTINDRSAFDLSLTEGPLTRVELGRRTGLSKVTASQLLARMQQRGLVEVVGTRSAGRGPSAEVYAVRPGCAYSVGVDLNPDSAQVAIADVTGSVVARVRRPVNGATDPKGLIHETVAEVTGEAGLDLAAVDQVVIGM